MVGKSIVPGQARVVVGIKPVFDQQGRGGIVAEARVIRRLVEIRPWNILVEERSGILRRKEIAPVHEIRNSIGAGPQHHGLGITLVVAGKALY